jgi:NAD(P)-dependent dehydrogenase (short-subunit alcohol dehydrogenase family)
MNKPFDLTDNVALVTGASRGLGQHFARVLAAAGADLAITSRKASSLQPLADELTALGRRVACVELDVREHASIERAVAEVMHHFSRTDILVNNAGCNIRKPAAEVTWADWNEIVDTNLRGAFFVAQSVASQMIPRQYGRIVNIGSVTCVAGYAGLAPYGASRGGIKQMTMSLAHDWGSQGITVNCLAPGWFKTAQNSALYDDPGWVEYLCERIPLGRPGKMEDLDGALLLLASDAGRYITGQTILVDGGISVGALRALPTGDTSPRDTR